MTRKIIVLDSAKAEFRDIKEYVKQEFGDSIWNTVNAEYKTAIRQLKTNPKMGRSLVELKDLGITDIRYVLVRQTRIVYELSDESVIVHMFINTRRDFRCHLLKRLLDQ